MSEVDDLVKESMANLALGTAAHECGDVLVKAMQNATGEWHSLDEDERERIQQTADQQFRDALGGFANAIASGGYTRIPAFLDEFKVGKTSVAKLTIPEGIERHLLHSMQDARRTMVTVVIVPIDTLAPTKKKPEADDPQMDLLAQAAAGLEADDPAGGGTDSEPDESDTDDEP